METKRRGSDLAQILYAVAGLVQGVQAGQSVKRLLPQVGSPLRPSVQALTFHVLRHWGVGWGLAQHLLHQAPSRKAQGLLVSALTLLQPRQADRLYNDHTVVHQAVQCANQHRDLRPFAALINACLRRYLRESEACHQAIEGRSETQWNHPKWWIDRLQTDHPMQGLAWLAFSQIPAPLVLRVNASVAHLGGRQGYLERLRGLGIEAEPLGEDSGLTPHALVLKQAVPIAQLPEFEQGSCTVQDGAAQQAVERLLPAALRAWQQRSDTSEPFRVLDACAAPGGKTTHLFEWLYAFQQQQAKQGHTFAFEITALEHQASRLPPLISNIERLLGRCPSIALSLYCWQGQNYRLQIQQADAAEITTWWNQMPFDAILLDAPCSASGIVRRQPDIPWLRRESDLATLAAQQSHLLRQLWKVRHAMGHLLYATCSVFKVEGVDVVASFLKEKEKEKHHQKHHQKHQKHQKYKEEQKPKEQEKSKKQHLASIHMEQAWVMALDAQPAGYDGFYYAHLW